MVATSPFSAARLGAVPSLPMGPHLRGYDADLARVNVPLPAECEGF